MLLQSEQPQQTVLDYLKDSLCQHSLCLEWVKTFVVGGWHKPITVFSLAQAEKYLHNLPFQLISRFPQPLNFLLAMLTGLWGEIQPDAGTAQGQYLVGDREILGKVQKLESLLRGRFYLFCCHICKYVQVNIIYFHWSFSLSSKILIENHTPLQFLA